MYLAVTGSYDDPSIAAAETAARSVGYDATASDLGCDVGAAEALGRDPASFAATVAVYFDDSENAKLARGAFEGTWYPGRWNGGRVACLPRRGRMTPSGAHHGDGAAPMAHAPPAARPFRPPP